MLQGKILMFLLKDILIPAHSSKSVCCCCFYLITKKNVFVLCNRNEGWSENNIPWWRGPRARSGTRGYYYCLGSERPLCIYKVKMLEFSYVISCDVFPHASLVTTHLVGTGVSGDRITWLTLSHEFVWVVRGALRWVLVQLGWPFVFW